MAKTQTKKSRIKNLQTHGYVISLTIYHNLKNKFIRVKQTTFNHLSVSQVMSG